MKLVCVEKCFYRNRLWTPGEFISPVSEDEKLPRFFVEKGKVTVKEAVKIQETPKTFKGIQDAEAEAEKLISAEYVSKKAVKAKAGSAEIVDQLKAEAIALDKTLLEEKVEDILK